MRPLCNIHYKIEIYGNQGKVSTTFEIGRVISPVSLARYCTIQGACYQQRARAGQQRPHLHSFIRPYIRPYFLLKFRNTDTPQHSDTHGYRLSSFPEQESVVKLDSETCDSFVSVIPAKAGIQNRSMPQRDLDTKTPWIPAKAGMTCNLTTRPSENPSPASRCHEVRPGVTRSVPVSRGWLMPVALAPA